MQTVTVRHTIKAPIADVFDWFVDGANYAKAPTILRSSARIGGAEAPHHAGAIREVLTAYSFFREEITFYDRPTEFHYLVIKAIPRLRHEGGRMIFRETEAGTDILWTTTFEAGYRYGSSVLTKLAAPTMKYVFNLVLRTAARELEAKSSRPVQLAG